uniref:Integrase catalytic domain-containing protein n=1 Tax=Nicotiana tabacum TaxID=4097 RepID=A0A1S4AB01_TOBAC|nr:PREDICTED: uncharacterized protein LOC107795672 [Nicotiana tabacum]
MHLPVFAAHRPETISDEDWNFEHQQIQGLWLFNTLPDSWETLRVSLTNSAPGGKVTMEYAKSGVLNEEVRRKSQGSSSQADILVTEYLGRDRTRSSRNRGRLDDEGYHNALFSGQWKLTKEQGIRHQKISPKTPQLNGLAERKNRTLVERVRCLLSEDKLPNTFWAEALNTVAYVINLSPAVALDGDVRDRVWFAKDVSYDHLRVFGCKACVHVPKDERSKLDVKTKLCIFIGYGQTSFIRFLVFGSSSRSFDPQSNTVCSFYAR